jgi:hypothetical protein
MQLGEFLGDRNNPVARLFCQECGEEVFTNGYMTTNYALRQTILDFETPDHEHEIFFEKRVVSYF